MKETKLYIVLDEHTLNTMKGKGNKTAKFKTFEEADLKAAEKCSLKRLQRCITLKTD